jgi:hypothetical protein
MKGLDEDLHPSFALDLSFDAVNGVRRLHSKGDYLVI